VLTLAAHAAVRPPALQAEAPSRPVVGPQPAITCPAGAVAVPAGANVQRFVDSYPAGTRFCLYAGVHAIVRAITPKSGNTFVGEYGAVLDGSGWNTDDSTQAAFRAHNQDIDDVTIRNLVIRNMPQRGIHSFTWASDRWTVEYNEITGNRVGVLVPNASVVRHNYIHHNVANSSSPIPAERGGGYIVYEARDVVFDSNELAYNGREQKVTVSTNITFRGNFVHHNVENGIWYDGDNVGSVIERNIVEDNRGAGIFYEISGEARIHNNVVRRSGDIGVFISTSKNTDIRGNTLEDNFRGIVYFVSCASVGGGTIGWDLANVIARENIVKVGAAAGSYATGLSHTADCTPAQLAPYLSDAKRLQFTNNRYLVPSGTGRYWFWGPGGLKSFNDWQGLGRDRIGSLSY
jgi:parallel beta-helix repeat protein